MKQPAAAKPLTFEQIDAHVTSLDARQFQPGGVHHATATAITPQTADLGSKLCPIYTAIRPILVGIENFFFIPARWKGVIQTFVLALDNACPGASNPSASN